LLGAPLAGLQVPERGDKFAFCALVFAQRPRKSY
jgi:hypothetical protein